LSIFATAGLFALPVPLHYDSKGNKMTSTAMQCDGCGQIASQVHIVKRLKRLEWTTRYRPIHIQALLLSGVSPASDAAFLYSAVDAYQGEAASLLRALRLIHEDEPFHIPQGKPAEAALTDFQRRGLLLTHVLECPIENVASDAAEQEALLQQRVPFVISRIRRSLKPKRVLLISEVLQGVTERFLEAELGCAVVLDGGKPFVLDGQALRFREALGPLANAAR
jgi:hypothetical protein